MGSASALRELTAYARAGARAWARASRACLQVRGVMCGDSRANTGAVRVGGVGGQTGGIPG